jgi:hypothetical protein
VPRRPGAASPVFEEEQLYEGTVWFVCNHVQQSVYANVVVTIGGFDFTRIPVHSSDASFAGAG